MQLDLFMPAPPPPPPRLRHMGPEVRARILRDIASASAQDVGDRWGVSRNVVLGLVHRTRQRGVEVVMFRPAAPPTVSSVVPIRPRLPAPTPRLPIVGTPAPVVREHIVSLLAPIAHAWAVGPVPLLDAGPRQCRAIVGDEDALVCGQPVDGRGSWCSRHRLAFRAPARLRSVSLAARDLA